MVTCFSKLSRNRGFGERMGKGEKAGKAWITAVAQNFALGLAETRDFADGLGLHRDAVLRNPFAQEPLDGRVALDLGHYIRVRHLDEGDSLVQLEPLHYIASHIWPKTEHPTIANGCTAIHARP